MDIDRAAFRNTMAHFGAAVSIVTTEGPGGRCGFTCTSVCSVSDEPATILACLNRRSQTNPIFRRNGIFCVNVLGTGQEDMSAIFAGQTGEKMAERFLHGTWDALITGAPVLRNAVGALDCAITETKECGTHTILFGKVAAVRLNSEREPLMYFNRTYHHLGGACMTYRDGHSQTASVS